jgi:SOS response regulatory protein OraA/RecX
MADAPTGDFNRALAVALKSLAASEKFRAEVGALLERKGFDEPTQLAVLEHLNSKKLFDDTRCADLAVKRFAEKGVGLDKIRHSLESRGADAQTVEAAVASLAPSVDRARQALAKRFKEVVSRDKAARFLYSRGFSEQDIEGALEHDSVQPSP